MRIVFYKEGTKYRKKNGGAFSRLFKHLNLINFIIINI